MKRHWHIFLNLIFFSGLSFQRLLAQSPLPTAQSPQTIGPWTAWFQDGGIFLNYRGIPFALGGGLQLFAPQYAQGYYSSGSRPPDGTMVSLPQGGYLFTTQFSYQEADRSLDATQALTITPDGKIKATLSATWHGPQPAVLEWNPLRIWSYLLVGSSETFTTPNGTQNTIPVSYFPPPWHEAAQPFTTATFSPTALGELQITYQGEPGVCFDARTDPNIGAPIFWCGLLGSVLQPNQTLTETVLLQLTPLADLPLMQTQPYPMTIPITPHNLPDAQIGPPPLLDAQGHPVIVPEPKQVAFTQDSYILPKQLPLFFHAPNREDRMRLESAIQNLGKTLQKEGISLQKRSQEWNNHGLLIGVADESLPLQAPVPPPTPESYALEVTPTAAIVVGRDPAGAFYGIQTLQQLLKRTPSGQVAFAGVTLSDWPTMAFRGAHLFVGKQALPFHEKLIEQVLSRLKLNRMVIECEYTAWRSHPELHVPFSMSPHDLQKEVAFCRDHFMEPIPLVETLGHAQWLFANNQHLDIAEDHQTPFVYDVSNPQTYKIVFDIFRETLSIFHPKLFHIGHDEVNLFGKFPARPANIQKGWVKLFLEDTIRLHDWLAHRGVRTMIWSDMLLNPQEGTPTSLNPTLSAANAPSIADAQALRANLPKDIIICDWRYGAGSEQRNGLALFQQAGFQAIGSAWYEPENIRGWTQQVLLNRSLGTLQTTWAGYNSNEKILQEEFPQFSAFVLAAEYAWSGTDLHPLQPGEAPNANTLPYTASELFTRLYGDLPPPGMSRSGWLVDLSSYANVRIGEGPNGLPWQQTAPLTTDSNSIAHDSNIGIAYSANLQGVLLRGLYKVGTEDLPTSIHIQVNQRANTLALLSALTCNEPLGKTVATLTVQYVDGKTITVPLRAGYELSAMDDGSPSRSYYASSIPVKNGQHKVTLRLFRWHNPNPQQTIGALTFRAEDPLAGPILFSVTGVREE